MSALACPAPELMQRLFEEDGWLEWRGAPCPVAPTARVEVIQEMRHARGVALSFDWIRKAGPTAVLFWRVERECKSKETS